MEDLLADAGGACCVDVLRGVGNARGASFWEGSGNRRGRVPYHKLPLAPVCLQAIRPDHARRGEGRARGGRAAGHTPRRWMGLRGGGERLRRSSLWHDWGRTGQQLARAATAPRPAGAGPCAPAGSPRSTRHVGDRSVAGIYGPDTAFGPSGMRCLARAGRLGAFLSRSRFHSMTMNLEMQRHSIFLTKHSNVR